MAKEKLKSRSIKNGGLGLVIAIIIIIGAAVNGK